MKIILDKGFGAGAEVDVENELGCGVLVIRDIITSQRIQ